jgi:uncharacterized protein YcbK (DUF882 family)
VIVNRLIPLRRSEIRHLSLFFCGHKEQKGVQNCSMDSLIHLSTPTLEIPCRRSFLRAAAVLPSMGLIPTIALANDFWSRPRELWLKRSATGEEVKAVYWANGQLHSKGYVDLCRLLRDVKAGQAVQMDIVLLDILRGINGWFDAAGLSRPIVINSGFRTLHTNSGLEGAARNSMHLYAKAADLRMEGIPTAYLAKLGVYLSGGGVGFYQSKGFVHVDSGRLRTWSG